MQMHRSSTERFRRWAFCFKDRKWKMLGGWFLRPKQTIIPKMRNVQLVSDGLMVQEDSNRFKYLHGRRKSRKSLRPKKFTSPHCKPRHVCRRFEGWCNNIVSSESVFIWRSWTLEIAELALRPAPGVSILVSGPSLAAKLVANLKSYAANFWARYKENLLHFCNSGPVWQEIRSEQKRFS